MVYDKAQNSKWFAPPPPDPWPPVSRRPPVVASCGSFQGVCAHTHRHLQAALVVENPPANAGDARDAGPVPGWGRSGGGHGNPLQDSCLENPTDRRAWRATVHGVTMSSHTHTHTHAHTHTHTHSGSALLYISLPFSLDRSLGERSIFLSDKNQADSPSLRAAVNLSPAASMKWQALCFTLRPSARHKLVECLGQKDVRGILLYI